MPGALQIRSTGAATSADTWYWPAETGARRRSRIRKVGVRVPTIVVLTGGGIKSAVAAKRNASDHELVLLHADYGQRSARSEQAAVTEFAGTLPAARVVTIDMPHVLQLQEKTTRAANAVAEPSPPGGIVSTQTPSPAVVMGLTPMLLSLGLQCALRVGASRIITGVSNKVDATAIGLPRMEGLPDRNREFLHAYAVMTDLLLVQRAALKVEWPLIDLTYADIIRLADQLNVALDKTWTCERAVPRPCGRCDPCRARTAAFTAAQRADPAAAAVPA